MTTTAAKAYVRRHECPGLRDTGLRSPHERSRAKLSSSRAAYGRLYLSRQVLREYLAVVTRPGYLAEPLATATALDRVRAFTQLFHILEDGPAVMVQLDQLCRRVPVGGRQIHDANIVATMVAHGVQRLLTNNGKDFTRFADLIEILPLEAPLI